MVVMGLRPAEPGEDRRLIGQIVSDPLAMVIPPAPEPPPPPCFCARPLRPTPGPAACWKETGGNPLLDRELVHVIADELAPTEATCPACASSGRRPARARCSPLRHPGAKATLARAVAILGDDADPRRAAALADLEERAAFEAVDALARVDVLRAQPRLRSSIHSVAQRSTRRSHRSSETGDTPAPRVCSPTPARNRNASPRTCCAARRPQIRRPSRRCATPRCAPARAVPWRAPSPTFDAPSRSRRRTRSAPKCSSSSARPRRT